MLVQVFGIKRPNTKGTKKTKPKKMHWNWATELLIMKFLGIQLTWS